MRRVFRLLSAASACLFFSSNLFAQVTATYGYSGLPQFIYADFANVITVISVFVPRGIKMTTVTARVKIDYPQVGDLQVYLYSPEGTRTILTENDCGSLVNIDTTFADNGSAPWKSFCPVEAGRGPFQPDQPMTNFNNDTSSFGTWRLAVQNTNSDSRTGWIDEFAVTITGAGQTPIIRSETITNAADPGASGQIAPGEMLSIYGIGVGPSTPVAVSGGALPNTLGGVQVLINGTAIPLAYASLYRVDAQAPFSLPTGTKATVQLGINGSSTTSATVDVVPAVPAVYTAQPGGGGGITAVNQDGTMNSLTRPAPKGSFITIYASGLGTVSPPLTEGVVPPSAPLSNTTIPVTAVLGGAAAPVQFAGAAPGFTGLYQVNIQVPANAPSGSEELRIYVNGVASKNGTTVVIK